MFGKRIAAAWAAFFKFKDVLCNKAVTWRTKLRFFDAVITPTVLYGCAAWTITADRERLLTTTRRRMLRWMFGVRRQLDEGWVDFIRRSTHESETHAERNGSRDWVRTQKRLKWKFAGTVARQTDGRWSTRLLQWMPWLNRCGGRDVGRPHSRWQDVLSKRAGGDWTDHAQDVQLWAILTETA